ncbi:MAG: glycosyltransferase [Rhodocyclaceae bacterium]|nr:glycosyltransferase [Rhodocyclaceae bacterium]
MANEPRVLLHAFSTFNLGGPQARFVRLANEFGPAYTHIITAMDNCFVAGERLNPDIRWEPLTLPIKKGRALANRSRFREVLKTRRPDLLLSYNWGAIEWVAANIPGLVPHVHVEDGFGPEEAGGQLPRRAWMRRLLLAARKVPVVVASRQLERIARKQWWMPSGRVQFIPNGVEIPDGDTKSKDRQQGLTIGTVAGLRPEKNVARLIKAFAAVRQSHDARLVIVGDGPERGNLEALADKLGVRLHVEFTGYLKNPQERLRDFDLFALSSDTEQLPIAMLEAMAYGVPCVATRVGDVEEVIPDVAREALSEPNDADFERALLKAIDSRDRWPQWTASCRDVVSRHYGMSGMLALWRNLFDEA